ncbi:M48 family metalloprotease [Azospirillum sp. RWY-5-1]|uniref:M48 family metalloprotease n=1 Tax=Azospirillum oleiclasticum TaxID=2735135 RepID=A0ABX2TG56_9PROT|nr:zinc metalloprotease HtpX [Azospirillum oleiclasticum]NYZ14181.1 M48 family metalloprotease [Azospirillum oleiclasticum]NYZ21665.1 M48 family metalloprotease [Azospirillum oleiclasticum]
MVYIPTDIALAQSRRRHKINNLIHSGALLGGLGLLLSLTGWTLAGLEGMLLAVMAGALSVLFAPRVSPRMVLGFYGARRLSYTDAPGLFEVVRAVSARAGLASPPTLHCVASPTLNAFAVGGRDQAAVALTDGLLRALTLRELAGVMAHEISHIRNNDLFVMGLADTMASLTRLLSVLGAVLLMVNLPLLLLQREPLPWLAVLLMTVAPALGALLQLALSRTREYDADLDAAYLTGDPEGLASALDRVERVQGRLWEGLVLPRRSTSAGPSLLRSHPHTEDRIRRLLDLRTPPPVLHDLDHLPVHVAFPAADRRPRFRLSGYWY